LSHGVPASIAPTSKGIQPWRDAAAPLLDEWKASVNERGGDADAILAAYKAALAARNADY
jgi:hypothetical protein